MSTTARRLLISEREAAKMLNLCPRTLFNLRQDGAIPFVRVRTRIMYRVSALELWLDSQEVAAKS